MGGSILGRLKSDINTLAQCARGATPIRVSLVPAYAPCVAPDRVHGPPRLRVLRLADSAIDRVDRRHA